MGQKSAETQCCAFWCLGISMSWFFHSWNLDVLHFVLWKNALESRCHGLVVSAVSRWGDVLVVESQCRAFLVLESWWPGFLVFRSQCRDICASTASLLFSLNLLCHRINVDMWVINANYFVSHKLVSLINE